MPHEELPIVLLYSSVDDEYINKECRELDVRHRLVKPINMKQLFHTLSRLIVSSDSMLPAVTNTQVQSDEILSTEPITVLIAEDQPVNMLLVTTILESIIPNATLIEAVNGIEAIRQFEQTKPDLIFMEYTNARNEWI
jgi:response regulator RpfG family c-di-GMP phosphodiesterase